MLNDNTFVATVADDAAKLIAKALDEKGYKMYAENVDSLLDMVFAYVTTFAVRKD